MIQHPSQGMAQPPSNSVSSVSAFQSQKPENKLAVTSGDGEAGRGRMQKEREAQTTANSMNMLQVCAVQRRGSARAA